MPFLITKEEAYSVDMPNNAKNAQLNDIETISYAPRL